MRAACPAYLSRLNLGFLIMLGEEYNECSSALYNFLHSSVISVTFNPKYLSKHFILEHP